MARDALAATMDKMSVALPPEHMEALVVLAAKYRVSVAQTIRWAVADYLEGPENVPQPTERVAS